MKEQLLQEKSPSAMRIAVLGSTGSVGRQTLDVARAHGVEVVALSGSRNIALMEEQIRAFRPKVVAMVDEASAAALRTAVADTDVVITAGSDAVAALAHDTEADMVFNSVTGIAGLRPTLAAIEGGHSIALANKETLVTAGDTVLARARKKGVEVLPVDSEHCAIFQCLSDARAHQNEVRRVILTASGGAFRGKSRAELAAVTPEEALRHPTWNMGPKITLDCASLANKGLEVIEAARLFSLDADHIDVVVHPQSIIHSMVEYTDSAVMAQLAMPDMRLCIQYALTWPARLPSLTPPIDFTTLPPLTFAAPDTDTFTLLGTAYTALRRGGVIPTVFNAANEVAAALFFDHKISFVEIFDLVDSVVRAYPEGEGIAPTIEQVEQADLRAREATYDALGALHS